MDFDVLVPDTSESEEGSPIQSWGIARSVPETSLEESQTEEEAVALCSGGLAAYDDDDPELSPTLAPEITFKLFPLLICTRVYTLCGVYSTLKGSNVSKCAPYETSDFYRLSISRSVLKICSVKVRPRTQK